MKKYIGLLLFSALLAGCEKETIPAGIHTTVVGRISDHANSPVPNAKVFIAAYEDTYGSGGYTEVFVRNVDSVLTDQDGAFQMTFTSSGTIPIYKVFLESNPENQSYIAAPGQVTIEPVGSTFQYDFNQVTKLFPCDLSILVNPLETFPIRLFQDFTVFQPDFEITAPGSYVRRVFIPINTTHIVKFARSLPSGVNQNAFYTFPPSQSESLTTQSITVNEADFIDQ